MTIKLTDTVSEVEICPKLGGSITSFRVQIDGSLKNIFHNKKEIETVLDSSCFPLVPFSNRIRYGKFNWQGKEVNLPLNHPPEKHAHHGHGWQVAWDVVSRDATNVKLEYVYKAAQWPFSYKAEQSIMLENGELTIKLALHNTGNHDMPAGLGLHPYFTRTPTSTLKAKVAGMWQVDDEGIPTSIELAPQTLDEPSGMRIEGSSLDNAFTEFTHQATITWPEWKAQANITTSDNCDFLVVYSPNDENFFCVEPVTHCTNAINMQAQGHKNTGAKVLKAGQSMTVWMKIKASSYH